MYRARHGRGTGEDRDPLALRACTETISRKQAADQKFSHRDATQFSKNNIEISGTNSYIRKYCIATADFFVTACSAPRIPATIVQWVTNYLTMGTHRSFAYWFLLGFGALLTIFFLLGQTMAIIDYGLAVALGLQEPATDITAVGVAFNKGFGFGDTFVYIPLFIGGLIGLLKRNAFGPFLMAGAMAITVYWPVVCLSALFYAKGSAGFQFNNYLSYAVLLALILVYGAWGGWYLFRNQKNLIDH